MSGDNEEIYAISLANIYGEILHQLCADLSAFRENRFERYHALVNYQYRYSKNKLKIIL